MYIYVGETKEISGIVLKKNSIITKETMEKIQDKTDIYPLEEYPKIKKDLKKKINKTAIIK